MGESNKVKYLIIGGGAAGAQGAVGVRELDKDGSVLLVGQEPWWPYDRPPLSKGMLMGKADPADAESKDPSWYEKNNVEVKRGLKATALDTASRTVTFADDSSVEYEKLLLATGSSPKELSIKGADLDGVHLFRIIEDSLGVKDAFDTAKHVIFIGAGYIGLEVASVALDKGLQVTFIDPNEFPWSRSTSPITGKFLKEYFESKGARFLMNEEVSEIVGENKAEGVVTKSGTRVDGDLVVAGIGITLNLELAKSGGLELDEKNGVTADDRLRTLDPDVYVAGDIAAFDDVVVGKRWHAEHYLNAKWQGKQAGKNMAGADEVYNQVPYFFSDFLDIHMALRGDPQGGKSAKVIGDPAAAHYIELYAREDGTLAMGIAFTKDEKKLDPIADKLEELFRARVVVADVDESTFGENALP